MSGHVIAHARPGRVRSYVPLIDASSGAVVHPVDIRGNIQVPTNYIDSNVYDFHDQSNGVTKPNTLLDEIQL